MQPGIIKDLTSYMAEGGWIDCDKIRFRASRPEKLGGWVGETVSQSEDDTKLLFNGVARDIISWSALDSKKYLAISSNEKIELMVDGQIFDITPVRAISTLSNALTTTLGTSEVTITDSNHLAVVGDWIYVVSQAASVGGITLSGAYQVTEVVDADNYKVNFGLSAFSSAFSSAFGSGVATASGSGFSSAFSSAFGGSSSGTMVIWYMLENGSQSNADITGWGGGTWDTPGATSGGWGMPRDGEGGINLRQISSDNWGEDLLVCIREGKIYQWDATNGPTIRLQEITEAPDENLFILVSQPSRHLISFGCNAESGGIFDPLIIRWAEQETLTGWTTTNTNTAGEFRLPKGNKIIQAVQTRSEIVVFTETDVYSMQYVGGNDIFKFTPLGTNISIASQHAAIDLNGVVYWMGVDNFYAYDGVVRILHSTLDKYIFHQNGAGLLDLDQKEKTFCGINKEFNELWWLYQKSGDSEIDNYVKFNFDEQVWDIGTIDRTVWLDKGTFIKPYAVDSSGKLFVHETGKDDDSRPMISFITTAYFDIDDGQDLLFLDKIVPDVRLASNRNIAITVFTKKYPHPTADITTKGPFYFDDTDTKISARARGRQMALEFRATATGSDFEIGKIRIGYQEDGGR